MPTADISFKLLVSEFSMDFATWLLKVDHEQVQAIQPLSVELPAAAVRIDQVFHGTLADGRATLLHIKTEDEDLLNELA